MNFQFLALPLLFIASIWFKCWHFWRCPRVFLYFPNFFFLNSWFFVLFWLSVYFFLMFQTVHLNHGFFPSLLVPYGFFFESFCVAFISSLMHLPYSVKSLSILTTSVLNSESDRLAICISLTFFLEFWSVLALGPYFLVSSVWQPLCVSSCVLGKVALTPPFMPLTTCYVVKGRVLGVQQCVKTRSVVLYVRDGSERGKCHLLISCPISSYFPHFLYAAGTLLAASLVLNPWVGGFLYILGPCGSFKQILLKGWQFLSPCHPPLVFTIRSYEILLSQHWNLGCMD